LRGQGLAQSCRQQKGQRGAEEFLFQPYDVKGDLLTESGKPLSSDCYLLYLARVLPVNFIGSREYNKYVDQMREYFASK